MAEWLTIRDLRAIETALNASLASEVIDSYDDGSTEEAEVRAEMASALNKIQERISTRLLRAMAAHQQLGRQP